MSSCQAISVCSFLLYNFFSQILEIKLALLFLNKSYKKYTWVTMHSTLTTITSMCLSVPLYAEFFSPLSFLLWEAFREQLWLIINNGEDSPEEIIWNNYALLINSHFRILISNIWIPNVR